MDHEHGDIAKPDEHIEEQEDDQEDEGWKPPRDLPADLPRSLNDRRRDVAFDYGGETEYYDGWQGTEAVMPAVCHIRLALTHRSIAISLCAASWPEQQLQSRP